MDEIEFDIKDIVRALKSRWKVIAAITTIMTLLAVSISYFLIKPMYKADIKVFVGKDQTEEVNYNNSDIEMYQKLLATYSELIKTSDLIENAISENNLDITVGEVSSNLEAIPRTDTQILQISYKNNDNVLTKEVLVAVVDEFIKETKILIPNGTVKVIESAKLPQYPVSPNKHKNISLGFLGGFILGIAIALLMDFMDNTFKTKEQIEKIIEVSVIGVIPCETSNNISRKDNNIMCSSN